MSRCVICDYLQGHGSELLDIPNKWNKRVKWRERYKEFQCDDCFKEVRELNYREDPNFRNTKYLDDEDLPSPVVSPAVPTLPIE